MPLEAGAGEGGKLAPAIGGITRAAPERAEMAAPGKGGGGGEIRIGGALAQCRQSRRGIRRADPLGREPGRDRAQRAAARQPAPRPAGGIGGVVDEARSRDSARSSASIRTARPRPPLRYRSATRRLTRRSSTCRKFAAELA